MDLKKVSLHSMDNCKTEEVYKKYMEKDFPPSELKPLKHILEMMDRGIYDSLGIVHDGREAGYALVLRPENMEFCLLDYFAVSSEKRGKGIGGEVLDALKCYYKDRAIMIEAEYPGDAPDTAVAERRVRFYERNGAADTGVESRVFGVHFKNLVLSAGKEYSAGQLYSAIKGLYAEMIPDKERRESQVSFFFAGEDTKSRAN